MKAVHIITFVLLVIGGLNWGLHAFDYNLVDMIFEEDSMLSAIVYVVVALSALVQVFTYKGFGGTSASNSSSL